MKKYLPIVSLSVLVLSTADAQYGRPGPPFGGSADVNFAKSLWKGLKKARFVGEGTIHSTPYQGTHPHGAILKTVDGTVRVSGQKGVVIVKKNYGGPEVSKTKVANNPGKYLKTVTVMFKRKEGYDPDNKNWFWVKYGAEGEILKNSAGKSLAGRVAKGVKDKGCIACHVTAPGSDYVFNHDRYAR